MDLSLSLVIRALDQATAPLRSVSSTLTKVAASAKTVGESLTKTGDQTSQAGQKIAALGQQAEGLLRSILAPASEVETAMAHLQVAFPNATGPMAEALDAVRAASIEWSTQHTQSAADYVAAAKLMMLAGVGEANAVGATSEALRVATAVGGDASAVARTLGVVYQQLGDKTKVPTTELGHLGDVLTRAKQLFPTIDVGALTDPLKDASPAAKQAGVSFEQLIATLGQLNAAGLQGGEAGASLAKVISTLGPASQKLGITVAKTSDGGLDLAATLGALEKKFGSLDKMTPETRAKLEAAFGPDTLKPLTLLLGHTAELDKNLAAIKNSAGAAANAQATLEGTTAAQAKIAEQSLDALKITLAAGIAPALKEIVPWVRDALAATTKWAAANPGLVKVGGTILLIVAAVGGIVGPVLVAAGALLSFAGFMMAVVVPALAVGASAALAFAAALLANPITWIVLAIVAAAILIYVYWEPISAFFIGIWDDIGKAFAAAAALATEVWDAASGAVTSVFTDIETAFQGSFIRGVIAVMALLNPGAILGRVFAAVRPILARVWLDIRTDLYALFDSSTQSFLDWWQGIVNDLHAAGAAVRAALATAWAGVRSDLYEAFGAAKDWLRATFVEGIKSDFAEVLAWVEGFSLSDAGANIVRTLADGMLAVATLPAEAMASITKDVRDYLPFSPAKEGALRDLHKVRLIETVAESMKPEPMLDAIAAVTNSAYGQLEAFPKLAAPPGSSAVGATAAAASLAPVQAAGSTTVVNVTLQVVASAGEDAVAALERFIANPSNAQRLARAVQLGAGLEARLELA